MSVNLRGNPPVFDQLPSEPLKPLLKETPMKTPKEHAEGVQIDSKNTTWNVHVTLPKPKLRANIEAAIQAHAEEIAEKIHSACAAFTVRAIGPSGMQIRCMNIVREIRGEPAVRTPVAEPEKRNVIKFGEE